MELNKQTMNVSRKLLAYCVELIEPSIPSNLQRLEAVLRLISVLLLLKFLKEVLSDWYRVGCIKRH